MPKYIGLIVALAVFIGWIKLIGNPHVVETVIGLVIASAAGIFAFVKTK